MLSKLLRSNSKHSATQRNEHEKSTEDLVQELAEAVVSTSREITKETKLGVKLRGSAD